MTPTMVSPTTCSELLRSSVPNRANSNEHLTLACRLADASFGATFAQVASDVCAMTADLAEGKLTVAVDTDLPSETTVIVSVSRSYNLVGTKDAFSEEYFSKGHPR